MMVKICGITNREDALAAVKAGANAIGLNFYRESPRYLSPTCAALIAGALPAGILKVGVFVDDTAQEITRIALAVGLDVAQLHGNASCPTLPTWRAVPISAELEFLDLEEEGAAQAYLLDTAAKSLHGGTGLTFRWQLARQAALGTSKPIIVAGGLDETNVQIAIAEAQPWGVDVCSRIESSPGKKDHERMKKFIQAAHAAAIS